MPTTNYQVRSPYSWLYPAASVQYQTA